MKTSTIIALAAGIGLLWYISTNKKQEAIVATNAVAGARG